jgi:hypothetical protein
MLYTLTVRVTCSRATIALVISFDVKGGQNTQISAEAGVEANLDVQFALGISFPIPGAFYSTSGEPPYIPDKRTPTNTNEPYLTVCRRPHCTVLVL